MIIDKSTLAYRKSTIAVVVDKNNKILLVQKKNYLKYDWADDVIEKKIREKGKTYLGQKVAQFLVKFLGEAKEIIYQPEEIKKIIWVKPSESDKYFVFPNQLAETKKLFEEFDLI